MERQSRAGGGRSVVVVPVRPGPVRALGDAPRDHDEVDDLLDDLFGEPDDRGPGAVDAALVVGGLGVVILGLVASWSTVVLVLGGCAVGLGAVLPVRSLVRRAAARRQERRVRALVGDGVLLRTDHASVAALVELHERLARTSSSLAPPIRGEVEAVGHTALIEVASLLAGRSPSDRAEVEYIEARCSALASLATTVADERVGDGDVERRRALVEARHEVDQIAGTSSIDEVAQLVSKLLGRDGG